MEKQPIPINPEVLQWARREAGLSLEDAASRARIQEIMPRGKNPGLLPEDRLKAWESGNEYPTFRQLEKVAKAYRRPAVTFFLPRPPSKTEELSDYRMIAERIRTKDSPEFSALKRRIALLHQALVDLQEASQQEPPPFVGSISTSTLPEKAAKTIRNALSFSFEEQTKLRDSSELLRALRHKSHEQGIFTLFEGDLGSHHSKIQPTEFRGIAICHKLVPLIVVNPNDAKAARVFTFAHELAHIFLGSSAISNIDSLTYTKSAEAKQIEDFCNRVAAELLLPLDKVLQECTDLIKNDYLAENQRLAKIFKVSRVAMARRLYDLRLITNEQYRNIYKMSKRDWEKHHDAPFSSEAQISKNALDKFRLGRKTIETVLGAVTEGRITLLDASRLLRVKASRFPKIS